MTSFHGDEAKKNFFFFEKKNSKWSTQKKVIFQLCQFSIFFCENDLFLSWPFWIFCFCFIPMKTSHKLCVRMDGTQFLWLWWYTAKTQSPQTFQPAVYIGTVFLPFDSFLPLIVPAETIRGNTVCWFLAKYLAF